MAGFLWLASSAALAPPRSAARNATVPAVATDAVAGVANGSDSVTLLAEPAFVEAPAGVFRMRVKVATRDPADDLLRINIYGRLTTRTGFDEALTGHPGGYVIYPLTVPVSKLRADPAGGVDIDIPINQAASDPNIPVFYASPGSGVFPVQVGITDPDGNPQGRALITYLVYAEPYPASGLPKLSVAVVVPVHGAPTVGAKGQIGPPTGAQSGALNDLVTTLGRYPGVRISLAVTPQTLDSLSAGSAVDRGALVDLTQLVRTGQSQLLPATYVSVPMRGWEAVGLSEELGRQISAGSSVLGSVFGSAPSQQTWVVNGPVDSATLADLQSRGARHLILPDAELSALPAVARTTTFALPSQLTGSAVRMSVYAADAGLTADVAAAGGDPVLAANHLLAELAMIQLETPGLTRGVVVLPPPEWAANPVFVQTLLAGLSQHPLLNPVTASGLFRAVPTASVQRSIAVPSSSITGTVGTVGTGVTASPGSSPSTTGATSTTLAPGLVADASTQLGADADTIRVARERLSGYAAVLPRAAQQAQALNSDLLTAESSDLSEAQRQALLGQIFTVTDRVTRLITLPRASSITLTSTKAQLPLTMLSAPSLRARVELRLSSQRLIFRQSFPVEGKCRVPTPTSEVCDLTLTTQNTTIKVPVESRSSGVFPLDVSLWTPDGSQLLARDRDTVRSTAVSGVGIVLMAVAVVSLGLWWARARRHGRRARQLVPAPGADPEEEGAANGAAGSVDGDLGGDAVSEERGPVVRDVVTAPATTWQQPHTGPRQ